MGILEKYKEQWRDWDIRFLILLSLFIQTILMFLGRWRKNSSSKWIQFLVWSTYLLANWVADFALGFLSREMVSSSANVIMAFWATFLFLHCGGPDTITAYTMEDCELWHRYLFSFGYEFIITGYVIFCFLPNTRLLTPIILVFLVAIIKNVERIFSLYFASSSVFCRPTSSLARLLAKLEVNKRLYVNRSRWRSMDDRTMNENFKIFGITTHWRVNEIFELYSASKPYFIDGSSQIEAPKGTLFGIGDERNALRVMDIQLSYTYDELYTKGSVNHSIVGYILRPLCSTCIVLAFVLYILAPKDNFNKIDVNITYVLLVASIFLDIMAFIILLFSNWMLVSLLNAKKLTNCTGFLAEHIARIKEFRHKNMYWSEEIPQLNLISNSCKHSLSNDAPLQRMINWIGEKLRLVKVTKLYPPSGSEIYTLRTLQSVHVPRELQEIIVDHALRCSDQLLSNIIEVPGYSALTKQNISLKTLTSYSELMGKLSLDCRVFVWHIATELCFHRNSESLHPQHYHQKEIKVKNTQIEIEVENNQKKINVIKTRSKRLEMDACKALSNYMMHMVLIRPEIMSTMRGTTPSLFWDAYKEMVQFIKLKPDSTVDKVYTDMRSAPKVDLSLFSTARVFYRMMLCIEEEKKWQVMVSVWVELMLEGIKKIKPNMLLKQLSRGGDLIIFIWLLTKHVGISGASSITENYVTNGGIETAKDLLSEIELHLRTKIEVHGECKEDAGAKLDRTADDVPMEGEIKIIEV